MFFVIAGAAFIIMLLVGLAWTAGYFMAKAIWGCPTPDVHHHYIYEHRHTGPYNPGPEVVIDQYGREFLVEYHRTARRINYSRTYYMDGDRIYRYEDDDTPLFPLLPFDNE